MSSAARKFVSDVLVLDAKKRCTRDSPLAESICKALANLFPAFIFQDLRGWKVVGFLRLDFFHGWFLSIRYNLIMIMTMMIIIVFVLH